RSDFVNVAYWDAGLVTNDDGSATVEVPMPDDLTTWHVRVSAISGVTLVGEGESELVSTKPLLVRSALPRFVRVDDSVDLRVLVPETMSTSGIVTKGAALEAIYIPKFADTAHASLGISVRSALVGSLASELRWFDPCGTCGEEDTMSIASRVIGTIGVARMEKTTRYDARITTDIATIMGRQRPDGGFAWCTKPESTSDPNVTGWVLFALRE